MPVRVTRKRGGVWYAGGTVKVGKQVVQVPEYSTGCTDRAAGDHVAAQRDAEIRTGILEGPAGRAKQITIAEALTRYTDRPAGIRDYDKARVLEFARSMGHRPITEAIPAWGEWLATRAGKLKPTTVARSRATLQAALNHGASALDIPAPKLPGVRGAGGTDRVIYLTPAEWDRFLAAYNPHAACPVLLLAYQGMRTQEALRLDWRHVSLLRRTITIPAEGTKTGKGRTVPMHDRVDRLLFGMWHAAGCPDAGSVFLSARGTPYADTRGRDGGRQGGNPLARAHATACKTAGITGFRVHDWRHAWAVRLVMAGVDLLTVQRLGGWASVRMVQRYASVTAGHMAEAINRAA